MEKGLAKMIVRLYTEAIPVKRYNIMYEFKDDSKQQIIKGLFIGYLIIGCFAGMLCAIHRWII